MKITNLLSLISTAVVALSQPAWAGGGGGGGFHGGGFGGGFRGGGVSAGGFRGGVLAVQPAGGIAVSRGGGVGFGIPRVGGFRGNGFRAAPYRYGGTYSAGRSLGDPTGAFRYYNGASRTSPARTYQFNGQGNQSTRSNAGRNAAVARQQNRPASLTNQNIRTSNAQSSAAVRKAMANHRVFARHDGNWHHDWDKHHAHFDHGHVFVFTDGFWWDSTRGIITLTTLTAPILRIPTTIPTATMIIHTAAMTITPRIRIVTTAATPPHLKVATQLSAQSSRSWQNLGIRRRSRRSSR